MNWKTKASKAIKNATADEFFTGNNPLIPIVLVILIAWIILKIFL